MSLGNQDFSIINEKDTEEPKRALIYITSKPGLNVLTLTITPRSVSEIDLKGSPPVSGHSPDGGSSFVFNFERILTDDEVSKMDIVLPGKDWNKKFFKEDEDHYARWSIAPDKDIIITEKDPLCITIRKIVCTQPDPSDTIKLNEEKFKRTSTNEKTIFTLSVYDVDDTQPREQKDVPVIVHQPPAVIKNFDADPQVVNV